MLNNKLCNYGLLALQSRIHLLFGVGLGWRGGGVEKKSESASILTQVHPLCNCSGDYFHTGKTYIVAIFGDICWDIVM